MNGSDSSSANEAKITAQSVEGEDDIVDVTMKDASDPNASSQATGGAHKYAWTTQTLESSVRLLIIIRGPAQSRQKSAPAWVDPEEYLPSDLQNLFSLSYFTESNSFLAGGMHSVSEDKEYPKLSSRAPDTTASDDTLDNATNGTASNEDSSSDEVSRQSAESPLTRMNDESDDEDVSPVVKVSSIGRNIRCRERQPHLLQTADKHTDAPSTQACHQGAWR